MHRTIGVFLLIGLGATCFAQGGASSDMKRVMNLLDQNYAAREQLLNGGRWAARDRAASQAVRKAFAVPQDCARGFKMDVISARLKTAGETRLTAPALVALAPGKELHAAMAGLFKTPAERKGVSLWADLAYMEACTVFTAPPAGKRQAAEVKFAALYRQRAETLADSSAKDFAGALAQALAAWAALK